MRLLVTGADRPLGGMAARHFAGEHRLLLCGVSMAPPPGLPDGAYSGADLRSEEDAGALVEGIDAVLHLAEFDAAPSADRERLDRAARGTYVLCRAAREAGVGRIVVASGLAVFDAYPDQYLIDEQWRPRPAADAGQLAPYLCELVVREFAREGPLSGVALRFGPLGDDPERGTRPADALRALSLALAVELGPPGYRWHVVHVASSPRFIGRQARLILGFEPEGPA